MSSRPTLLVVLVFSESLRYNGLSMVRTQGIYTVDLTIKLCSFDEPPADNLAAV